MAFQEAPPTVDVDVKHESSARVVWALAWPAVALNSMQVVNNFLDTFFIGQLDKASMTAHAGSMAMIFLLFSLAMSLGTSATALVSRAYGAGQIEEFQMAARQNLAVSVLSGIAVGALGALAAPFAAHYFLPADNPRAIELMTQFLLIWSIALPAIFIIQTLAGSLRGVGDTKSPMVISGIQILLHIALNFIFIFPPRHLDIGVTIPGFNMGLSGGAAALCLSAWISAIGYLIYSSRTPLGQAWHLALPTKAWTARILKIALPAAAMAVLRVGSFALFIKVLASVPDASTAIAAMRPGITTESIMFMPAFGLSMAAAALVGQSLGMGRPDRAERLAWTAGHHGAIVMGVLSIPIFFGAEWIALVLSNHKEDIAREAAMLLRYLCLTEVMFGYAMVMIGAMQGAGDTVRPMWITILALWVFRVPLAWGLAIPLGMGAAGAWIGMSITQAVQGIMAIVAFKQGAWKHKEV